MKFNNLPEFYVKNVILGMSLISSTGASQLMEKMEKLANLTLSEDNPVPGLRNLQEPAQTAMTNLNRMKNYGCWCNFDNHRNGKGQPLDHLDSACKRLHDNYVCITETFADQGEICQPESVQYFSDDVEHWIQRAVTTRLLGNTILLQDMLNDLWTYCQDKNVNNQCAIEACMAESYFLYEVYPDLHTIWFPSEGNVFDISLSHNENPNFDFEASCDTSVPGDRQPECCGATPYRQRFNSLNKACCENNGEIYNPNVFCCGTDGVNAIGGC